ncbi:hypothetical protein psyc5s11_21190 [Clostridium gelidum]|uniref:Uncharacterized protein n=1 Tax=Clostridium gelidum TaxID=704125 RepID=A0ABM7T430_9CLOT|nr:efflux RND transporter periplasmic adaptor subunit [Clostridium gelidum]BCZ46052.1 hypothetical protein psyc5s11_21190 [Clostridium gelidum]
MKLSFKKKNLGNKEIINKEVIKKKFLNKKVIIISTIIIIIIVGIVGYKIYANKKALAAKSNVKYTVLNKTNLVKSLSTSGSVKSDSNTNVYSNSTGKVKTVNVSVGDKVKAGDVLAVLDTETLEQDIAKLQETIKNNDASTQIDLENNKKAYDNLIYLYDNNLNTDLISKETAVNSNKLDLETAQKNYDYNKVMLENGEVSQEVLNKAKNDYEKAKANYDNATVNLENSKVTVQQSLDKAKNDYEKSKLASENKSNQMDLENKQKALADCTIVAPVDGTITNVNATVGNSSSGALFKIEDLSDLIVNVSIAEVDVPKIKVGQKANITTDATGKEVIAGEIMSIDPISSSSSTSSSSSSNSSSGTSSSSTSSSTSTSTDVTFTAKVKIDSKNENIKEGMNAIVNIVLDEKDDIYAVPYSSIVKSKNGNNIYVAEEQKGKYVVKEIPVTKGIESDVNIEIQGEDIKDGLIVIGDTTTYKPGSIVQINKNK